jgi:hypothetical protein
MVDVVGKFGSFVNKQKEPIQMLLVALILISWAPTEVLGSTVNTQLNKVLGPVLTPVRSVMSNVFVRLLLWLVLLYSCCFSKDMDLFFLISVYFLSSR